MFDTSELRGLIADLGKLPGRGVSVVASVLDDSGEELRQAWADNATQTAGEHGRFYPKAITVDRIARPGLLSTLGVEVGPDRSKKQGGMGRGFEYGSVNQPPHLDGHRALDVVARTYERNLTDAVAATVERGL